MLGFAESFFAWLASTGVSAICGLLIALVACRYLKIGYLLSFSVGVLFWVFVDVINDSGDLDVNASFSGGWEQVAIVALFAIGVGTLFLLDRSASPAGAVQRGSIAIPVLIAIAIGIHGLGEGVAFGNASATTPATSLLAAFGGEVAGAAYVLHKLLEAFAIGAGYVAFEGNRNKEFWGKAGDACILILAFVAPSVVAEGVGYFVAFDSTYFYAIGTGGLLFALLKLTGSMLTNQRVQGPNGSLKLAAWLIAGVLCVYTAALLHSYVPYNFG